MRKGRYSTLGRQQAIDDTEHKTRQVDKALPDLLAYRTVVGANTRIYSVKGVGPVVAASFS